MGEAQGTLFAPDFNRSIKVQTFSQKLTSHAGTVLRAGGRVVKHARRLWLHIEQSVGSFWKVMTRRIG